MTTTWVCCFTRSPRTDPTLPDSLLDERDPDGTTCSGEALVECGDAKTEGFRQTEVSSVVDGEVVLSSRLDERQGGRRLDRSHLDRKLPNDLSRTFDSRTVDPPRARGKAQAIRDLHRPMGRSDPAFSDESVEDRLRAYRRLILEAPRKGDRRVDDEHYRRPSSIKARIDNPFSRLPRRSSRKCCSLASMSVAPPGPGGMRTATGRPCLVIVMRSPFATSSSNLGRWVFAS